MSDNKLLPASGAGSVITAATDEVGGVDYQRVKLSLGPDGTVVDAKGAADLATGPESGLIPMGTGPGWHREATANLTGAGSCTIYVGGCGSAVVDLSGTFSTMTGSVQGSIDGGSTWADLHTVQSYELLNSRGEVSQSGISTARRYYVNTFSYTHIRYNITALTSGTVATRILAQAVPYGLTPSNQQFTLLGSGARTSTTASSDVSNYHNRGAYIFVNVTSITATPIITIEVQGKEPVGSGYFTIASFDPISAVGSACFQVYPGADYIEGIAVSASLPRSWRVNVVHSDADSITYSIGVMGLL